MEVRGWRNELAFSGGKLSRLHEVQQYATLNDAAAAGDIKHHFKDNDKSDILTTHPEDRSLCEAAIR
jgi:hypothetical protein